MNKGPFFTKKGFSLLEGVLTLSIFFGVVVVLMGELIYNQQLDARSSNMARATNLAAEGIEALKNIRAANFFDLINGNHGLQITNGRWSLALDTPDIIDNFFQREIKIFSPSNDEKQIEVVVSWPLNIDEANRKKVKLTTKFRNWFATVEDWSHLRYDGDFDFTAQNNGSNNHKVQAVLADGNYLLVGNGQSDGKEFIVFDLTKAPLLTMRSGLDLVGNSNSISVFGHYAFIASSANAQELQVINYANADSPTLAAYFDVAGNDDALTNDISDNGEILVLGKKDNLSIFNIRVPERPVLISQFSLSNKDDNFKDLKIKGDNIFLITKRGNLLVVNIAVPALPSQIAQLPLPNCHEAESLDIVNERFYIGCEGSDSEPEFFVGSVANPAAPLLLSNGDAGDKNAEVRYISFDRSGKMAFLLVGSAEGILQVWDISNDLSPLMLSSITLRGIPSKISYSPLARKVFIGFASNPEIRIIAPSLVYE